MTFFNINTDAFESKPEYVRVLRTHIGQSVFAVQRYPATAVIGEIVGELHKDPQHGDEYTIEFDDELYLNPAEPFRFLNHSCNPNCEFELLDQPETKDEPAKTSMYLIALRDIFINEQLTIDYNWPASAAIPCKCGDRNCRGWVVSQEELADVVKKEDQPASSL